MKSKVFDIITKERPIGTTANDEVLDFLEEQFKNMNYSIQSLPFDCVVWEKGKSTLEVDNFIFEVQPSPFSVPFNGSGKLCIVKTVEQLKSINCEDSIILMAGKLTENPLQPKNFPFYYPEDHKQLISLLEEKHPKAIIAVTGKNPVSGQNPFPLFEDGNFLIPSCNINNHIFSQIEAMLNLNTVTHLTIDSNKAPAKSRQILAFRKAGKSTGKIVICAHMDTKYNTPGALDNASGVAVLLKVAELLKDVKCSIDIVPFNGEEYYGACGELEYLKLIDSQSDNIELMINIDSPCHKGAKTAISSYNLPENISLITNSLMDGNKAIIQGQTWYAGDHAPFVFRGIPCLAVSSSDLFNGALEYTHTPKDTLDTIDFEMVNSTAEYLAEVISVFSDQK